ncbi:hypothetical protein BDV95DRAFT_489848 [Massariosphaeria phaeospora]|uniref:F-box domain-containing protein n=1 Tax=Massariosphaeria phaeospora TaxID=100035 RepID=A0A7C8MEU2_9PLEO|nr:hypothetical protein BDV95DRAFT_489848 [Massariosphaeria phaeospora]
MSSADHLVVIDSDDAQTFPHFLARYVNRSADVAALIDSIDSSQQRSSPTSRLPHLPAEIVLNILEHLPVDYVLDWRLVCRGFRDAIDGRVLYGYLRRAELIGYTGPKTQRHMHSLAEDVYEQINLLRAHFSHVTHSPTAPLKRKEDGAKWSGSRAVFHIENSWLEAFDRVFDTNDPVLQSDFQSRSIVYNLEGYADDDYGTLRWCMKLDKAVLDVPFPRGPEGMSSIDVSMTNRTVILSWKRVLFEFLKMETALRKKLEKKRDSPYTFSHTEDCLRSVRRQQLCSALDRDVKVDREIRWAMNQLRPLFGKPRFHRASPPWDGIEQAEDDAMEILIFLRREASLSVRELAYLYQLSEDRTSMEKEMKALDRDFETWKSQLYQPAQDSRTLEPLPELERNPVAWSDEVRAREEKRVTRWKTQKKTMDQVTSLLKASNEALSLPEDAFDDSGSEI